MKVRVIRDDCGNPYLVRLSIVELFGFALKLHIILRSDRDRELHDHPWSFITWMISGGYWEHRFTTEPETAREWVKPGAIRFCRAPYPHRLELENPAVTLVLMFPKKREWGFYKRDGWVPWFTYKSDQEC
jgi:hypothetical protein